MHRLSGGGGAAVIVKDILHSIHGDRLDGLSKGEFSSPHGMKEVEICPRSGKLLGKTCPESSLEDLSDEELPLENCQVHKRIRLEKDLGPGRLGLRNAVVWPLKFADWAAKYDPQSFIQGVDFVGLDPKQTVEKANIKIIRPEAGLRIRIDPETPKADSSIELRAMAEHIYSEIVFRVNEKSVGQCRAPCSIRWPLEVGEHWIWAETSNGKVRSKSRRLEVLP